MSVSWSESYEPEDDAPAYSPEEDTCEYSYHAVCTWERFVEDAETIIATDADPDIHVEPIPATLYAVPMPLKVQSEEDIEYLFAMVIVYLQDVCKALMTSRSVDLSEYIEDVDVLLKRLKRLQKMPLRKSKKQPESGVQLKLI